jgi:hypothetical protein
VILIVSFKQSEASLFGGCHQHGMNLARRSAAEWSVATRV